MSVISKQLVMSRLNLPSEVIDIIKDYCFDNIEYVAKINKKKINKAIKSFEIVRANHDHTNPRWGLEFPIGNKYGDKFMFDACFCEDCGNYKYNTVRRIHMNVSCSPSIYCNCYNDYYNIITDDDYYADEADDAAYWENYAKKFGYYA